MENNRCVNCGPTFVKEGYVVIYSGYGLRVVVPEGANTSSGEKAELSRATQSTGRSPESTVRWFAKIGLERGEVL